MRPDAPAALAASAPPAAAPTRPASGLEACGVCAQRGGRHVLDGISLTLHAGQWTAIVGPNGAGKSTLLGALAGLLPLQAGTVALQGRMLADWPPRERARRLAWLAQQTDADGDLPARDVVRLGRLPRHGLFGARTSADEAAVDAALAESDATALGGRRLDSLSGGERQRVLLARLWAVDAAVWLLDEPTAHLDPPHQRLLVRSLHARARRGDAVATVLHDLTLALAADRVLVLAGGRIAADAAPGDPALHDALEAVFGDAFTVRRVIVDDCARWVVVPRLGAAPLS